MTNRVCIIQKLTTVNTTYSVAADSKRQAIMMVHLTKGLAASGSPPCSIAVRKDRCALTAGRQPQPTSSKSICFNYSKMDHSKNQCSYEKHQSNTCLGTAHFHTKCPSLRTEKPKTINTVSFAFSSCPILLLYFVFTVQDK